MLKYKYIFFLTFWAFNFNIQAQEILLEKSVDETPVQLEKGPNQKNFSHFWLGYGFNFNEKIIVPNGEGTVFGGYGNSLSFGHRYKRKLNHHLSFGNDFYYNFWLFTPNTIFEPSRASYSLNFKFRSHNVGLSPFFRVNYGKRGNHIGNFIDFAPYAQFAFSNTMKQVFNREDVEITEKSKVDEIEILEYGGVMRLGFGNFILFGKYRISDKFSNHFNVSPYTVGLQIGLHKR